MNMVWLRGWVWLSVLLSALPARAESVVVDSGCAATEIWVANTRSGDCDDPPRLSRCTEGDGWQKAKLAELRKLPPGWTTCVWIHGNDNSDADARYQGKYLMQRLAGYGAAAQGVRVLVWSWPSEKTGAGPLEDLRIKARRSDSEAHRLSAFVRRWQPGGQVTFVGYSFGGRIITGALDDLAEPVEATSESDTENGMIANAVLMAPAMNNCWLLPGNVHGEAVAQVNELLIVKNSVDRALKWYPIVAYGRLHSGPQALGYTGLPGVSRLGEDADKVVHYNVSRIIGPEHDVMRYLSSPRIMGRVAPYVFGPASDDHGD
ncbi:MAG: alpha/beta hydrolase [Planctomycetia bacterium]|nr:alpha/beta hydrolase [Planctomycetia bacterium]